MITTSAANLEIAKNISCEIVKKVSCNKKRREFRKFLVREESLKMTPDQKQEYQQELECMILEECIKSCGGKINRKVCKKDCELVSLEN